MTLRPGNYNFTVYQGATFQEALTWKDASGNPVNLTGYTARFRAAPRGSSSLVMDLTTENGGITLGGTAGTVTLAMSAEATAALTPGSLNYDLEMISGSGSVSRLLEGAVTVRRDAVP